MTEVTLQIPDELANKVTKWLPTIIQLNLIDFQTPAFKAANETIRFLLEAPAVEDVLSHHPSTSVQNRANRLMILNQADLLSSQEQRELDELEQIEHVMRMLKLQIKSSS